MYASMYVTLLMNGFALERIARLNNFTVSRYESQFHGADCYSFTQSVITIRSSLLQYKLKRQQFTMIEMCSADLKPGNERNLLTVNKVIIMKVEINS